MAGSQVLRFDVIGDASSASRAFRQTADSAALAARGAKQFSESLGIQSKSARVSADATLALAKSDSVLRDAQLTLAGATDDASGSLGTLRRRLDELNGKTAAARVSLAGDKEAQARLDAISARLVDLDHKTASPALDIQGVARATAELSAVDLALDKVGGSGKQASGDLESLGGSLGKLSNLGIPALIGAGVALSPVIATVGTGLGGLAVAAVQTAGPILKASQAAGGLQDNMASLSPVQQQMARQLITLQGEAGKFTASLQPEVVKVWGSSLSLAGDVLHDIQPVAKATGDALGTVIGDIGADLKTGEWQQFFGFMAREAGPDVKQLGDLFVSLLNDLPPLLEDLQPVAAGFLGIATDAAKAVGALEKFENIAQQTSRLADQSQKSGGNDPFSLGSIATDAKKAGEQLLGSLFPGFSQTTSAAGKFAKSQGDAAAASAKNTEAVRQQAAAQQAAVTAATDLSANLTTLEARYGLTAGQAQALVTAAGQTDKALQGSGSSASDAVKAIEKYADASLSAQSPSRQLAAAISTLDNNTLGATLQLDAFTAAWNIIIGNSVSDQQAILNTAQAFEGYSSAVKTSGKNSTAAQQAFLSIVTAMGTGLSTLQKNGATVGQLNSFYQTSISRLNTLHGLTPAQRKDVQDVTHDYDVWASSTSGLNSRLLTASGTIKNNFTANLKALGEFTPGVTGDVNSLANSILKSGTQSSATQGARARLIADLKQAGVSADSARRLVNGLQGQISALKGKTVSVGVHATASGGVTIEGQHIAGAQLQQIFLRGMAAGGRLPGYGGGDRRLIMAEDGETVVSKETSRKLAPVFAAHGVPGYAAGGLVGYPDAVNSAAARDAGQAMLADAGRAVAALKAKAAAAATAAAAAFAATQGASGGIIQSMMRNMAAARGWAGAQWNALAALETREAGWSMTARNPTSGAYGLAQFINGPSEYAQYGGNSTTAQGQITGMLNYIAQRYGTPAAAWAHEVNYGWYGNGLNAVVTKPTLIGVGERGPEHVQVTPAIPGRGGAAGNVTIVLEAASSGSEFDRFMLAWVREHVRVKGGGSVQTAFGRQ